jgi:hypothetical protein
MKETPQAPTGKEEKKLSLVNGQFSFVNCSGASRRFF